MTTLERLAEFISGFSPAQVTSDLIEAGKRCLLDLIGVACAGSATQLAQATRTMAMRIFASGSSHIWFTEKRLNATGAALANAAAASALDLDDGHRDAAGHPGAGIIPACLAHAQEMDIPYRTLLTAIALGYEVGCRIAASRDLSRLPTMSTGRWIAYGVAAAIAYIRQLDPKPTAQAMAIAGVHSPDMAAAGYSRMMGNQTKEGIPWATLTGISAVYLSMGEFTGPLDILDHPDYYDASRILENIGEQWAIRDVYFKPYGCCRWTHAAIDAMISIMNATPLSPEDIDEVRVETFERAVTHLTNETDPSTLEAVQYSLPFTLAISAIEGKRGLLPPRSELLGRADLVAFAEKVRIRVDPELNALFPARSPARVLVYAKGSVHERTILAPLGDPDNPMTTPRLEEKFRALTTDLLTEDRQDAIIRQVLAGNLGAPPTPLYGQLRQNLQIF